MIKTFLTICLGLAFCYATGVWLDKTSPHLPKISTKIAQNQKTQADPVQSTPVDDGFWRISAFCKNSCCTGIYADGITASGHVIQKGDKFVAADLPFGTLLTIEGYAGGLAVPVLDRGGAIIGNRIDVFFDDADGIIGHQRALNWGVKYLKVRILK